MSIADSVRIRLLKKGKPYASEAEIKMATYSGEYKTQYGSWLRTMAAVKPDAVKEQLQKQETMKWNWLTASSKNSHFGYDMYFLYKEWAFRFPITPSQITVSIESDNEEVSLIDGTNVNLLKSPNLAEISFDATFPEWKLPFAKSTDTDAPYWFSWYYDYFTGLMNEKCMFRWIVHRPALHPTEYDDWDTNMLVSLEELEIKESAEDSGRDPVVSFKLRQARPYGVRVMKTEEPQTTNTSAETRDTENSPAPEVGVPVTYKVKRGDDLLVIAKMFYDDSSKSSVIYETNKELIEKEAKRHSLQSSSNGRWIFPDTELIIPYVSQAGVVDDAFLSMSNGGD